MMVREAFAEDMPRLLEMAARFLHESRFGALFEFTEARIVAFIEQINARGIVLVAEASPILGGPPEVVAMMGIVGPIEHPFSKQIVAEEMAWWVEPEYRTLGIGDALLHQAEHWACSKAIHMLKMGAPSNSDIGRFYERRGYAPVETSYVKLLPVT